MSEVKTESSEPEVPFIFQKIRARFAEGVLETSEGNGELTVIVRKDIVLELMAFLRNDPALDFKMLVDVTAVDYMKMEDVLMKFDYARFMVVYHLLSLTKVKRLRVKVPVHEKELSVPSMAPLWRTANWLERETYDMFGITFDNHPDLRRILMPDDYEGHPLRKDYPLRGRGERERFNFERQNA